MTKLSDCCQCKCDCVANSYEYCCHCGHPTSSFLPRIKAHEMTAGKTISEYLSQIPSPSYPEEKCHFCGKPAPNWPGGCVPMCDKCLDDAEAENNSGSVDHKDEKIKELKKKVKTEVDWLKKSNFTGLKDIVSGDSTYEVYPPSVSPSGQSSKPTDTQIAPSEEWVKEFDKRFVGDGCGFGDWLTVENGMIVKSFIQSVREEAIRERDEDVPQRIKHSIKVNKVWGHGEKYNKRERLAYKRGWNEAIAQYWQNKLASLQPKEGEE